jgi:hypothetical protein
MADWRGGSETIRQNNLLADIFGLANADTEKRRDLREIVPAFAGS